MTRSHARWLALIAIAVAIAAFLVFPSRDRKVRATITRAAEAIKAKPGEGSSARRARLERELAGVLAPEARLQIPGLVVAPGRDAVIQRLITLTDGRAPVVQLDHIEVHFADANRASADLDAIFSEAQAGDLHGDARRAHIELEKRADAWLITQISATAEARPEPEARP